MSEHFVRRLLLGAKYTDNFSWGAHDERALRHFHVFFHECSRSDDAAGSDFRPIQNDGTHADEDLVSNGAGMNDGTMSDGDALPKDTGVMIADVEHRTILDVGLSSDNDAVDVTTQHAAKPNARLFTEFHGTYNDSTWGDKCGS